jgi:hypothetical protein
MSVSDSDTDVPRGAQDRPGPNFMGSPSLGLDTSILCDSLYSNLLLSVFLGLYLFGVALSWPQVPWRNLYWPSNTPGVV